MPFDWSALNPRQVGRYAEYLAKMEFTLHGFDVYTSEVDDKGIDFVIRNERREFHEVQVKAIRWSPDGNYVFMGKHVFKPHSHLHLCLVVLRQGEQPLMYLFPSTAWLASDRPACLVDRDFGEGMKSKPEYGLNLAKKHLPSLEPYLLIHRLESLR